MREEREREREREREQKKEHISFSSGFTSKEIRFQVYGMCTYALSNIMQKETRSSSRSINNLK